MDLLVSALLRWRLLALVLCRLARKSLLDCKRNSFFCFTSKITKGNSQTGVSFPCSLQGRSLLAHSRLR